MSKSITNVVIAGLAGQGVLRASDILSTAALASGHDARKTLVRGVSRRGGAVSTDVRFDFRIVHTESRSPVAKGYTVDALTVSQGKLIRPPQWSVEALQDGRNR